MSYITDTGLQIPSVQDLLSQFSEGHKANVSALLNTDPDSPLGEWDGLMADALRSAWEVLQIAYAGTDPDQAEGPQLDGVSAITGTTRAAGSYSRFEGANSLTVTLTAGTTVPSGAIFATAAGDAGPQFQVVTPIGPVIADGNYPVAAWCTVAGPIPCDSGTLTTIVTPVSGMSAVTNAGDAVLGTLEDTDGQLRIRRVAELQNEGSTRADAIKAGVVSITDDAGQKDVVSCIVNVNETAFATTIPAHSFEAVVFDGDNATVPNASIAQAIWDNKGAGVQAYGQTFGAAIAVDGTEHDVQFTRPAIINIAISITRVRGAAYVGDTNTKTAITQWLAPLRVPGASVKWSQLVAFLLTSTVQLAGSVAGGAAPLGIVEILSITIERFGSSAAPFTDLAFSEYEVPQINSISDITLSDP